MTGRDEQTEITKKLQAETGRPKMKRFYSDVAVSQDGPPFAIELDGRVLKTPMKATLAVDNKALAGAIAGEWRGQKEYIDTHSMHLTRLANTAIDRVAKRRAEVIDDLVSFAASDLLCYRAESPVELAARQSSAWDPVLNRAAERHGIKLEHTAGIMPVDQPAASLEAVAGLLAGRDSFQLAAIYNLASLTGSLILALALADGFIDAERAWEIAHIDEDWNIEHWGDDSEAAARRAARKAQFDGTMEFLAFLSPVR